MSSIHFNDGVSIDTSGDLRVIKECDGYYVVGLGWLIPVSDLEEGERVMSDLSKNSSRYSER